ncbi:unnamed protein product [Boreogadus saida]
MLAPQRPPTNRSSLSQANGEEGLTVHRVAGAVPDWHVGRLRGIWSSARDMSLAHGIRALCPGYDYEPCPRGGEPFFADPGCCFHKGISNSS